MYAYKDHQTKSTNDSPVAFSLEAAFLSKGVIPHRFLIALKALFASCFPPERLVFFICCMASPRVVLRTGDFFKYFIEGCFFLRCGCIGAHGEETTAVLNNSLVLNILTNFQFSILNFQFFIIFAPFFIKTFLCDLIPFYAPLFVFCFSDAVVSSLYFGHSCNYSL